MRRHLEGAGVVAFPRVFQCLVVLGFLGLLGFGLLALARPRRRCGGVGVHGDHLRCVAAASAAAAAVAQQPEDDHGDQEGGGRAKGDTAGVELQDVESPVSF